MKTAWWLYVLAVVAALVGIFILTATSIPFLGGFAIGAGLVLAFSAGRKMP